MEEIINVDLSDSVTYQRFQELYLANDEIFVPVGNFDKYVVQVLPELMIPPALNLGDAVLMSRRKLIMYAELMCWHVRRYQVRYGEQIFEFAELSETG